MADLAEAQPEKARPRLAAWIIALILGVGLLWFFGRGLLTGDLFAYRDGAHYHYSLFTYVNDRWSHAELPLWNPHDNLGQPLAGDPTAAVFYPVRLVAAILPIGASRQYQVYVVLHLVGAMAGAFWLARLWRCGVVAAGAAALVYGLSGVVLFQYCNVIFLVGAAWWPAAFAAIEWLRKEGSWLASMSLGAVLAMMILGGDAQGAYLALALAAWRFWWSADEVDAAATAAANEENPPPFSASIPMSRVLVTTTLLAASLAAVQVLPTIVALAESGRIGSDRPRSIYEVPAYLMQSEPGAEPTWEGVGQGLFGAPKPETHDAHIYSFSVAPWRVVEAVVPNGLGREFPENRRWGAAIGDEGGLWTPSLYFGILPLVVALGSFRFCGGAIRAHWLTWVFAAGLLAGFGWFGIGWIVGIVQWNWFNTEPTIGPQTGGLYWLFTVALPAFVQFRYPAKLLVPAMLALALLVARGWRQAFHRSDRLAGRLTILAAISGGALALVILARLLWDAGIGAGNADLARLFLDPLPEPNPLFGPLDRAGGWWDLVYGLCQTMIIAGAAAIALRSDLATLRIYAPLAALVVTGLDLAIANAWLIQYAPAPTEWNTGPIAKEIKARPPAHSFAPRIYRARGEAWWPAEWKLQDSPDRLAENVAWEAVTLRPKYHLLDRIGAVVSPGPWTRRDYELVMQVARKTDDHHRLPAGIIEMLGVDWTIDSAAKPKDNATRAVKIPLPSGVQEVSLTSLPARRAWIAAKVIPMPALGETSNAAVEARTREVLLDQGKLRDFATTTILEWAESLEELPETRPPGESCKVVKAYEEQIDLEVKLRAPGLVVLADTFDSGWSALVTESGSGTTHEAAIVRVNRVLRGVMLPPGDHRVSFVYQSPAVTMSIWISAAAWIFWLMWMEVARRRAIAGEPSSDEAPEASTDVDAKEKEAEPTKPSRRDKPAGRGRKRK